MKAIIQVVSTASVVSRESNQNRTIGSGLCVLVGIHRDDNPGKAIQLALKISSLRILPGDTGPWDLSVKEVGGSILLVSNFTLCGDLRGGRRPSWKDAAAPEDARVLYDQIVTEFAKLEVPVVEGFFGEEMIVSVANTGPTTLVLEI